jgi:hypothetical protein
MSFAILVGVASVHPFLFMLTLPLTAGALALSFLA